MGCLRTSRPRSSLTFREVALLEQFEGVAVRVLSLLHPKVH